MALRHISGPDDKSEPVGSKKKKGVDADSFRELMRVDKASEVDPEQKRKRKRREEAESDQLPAAPGSFLSGSPSTQDTSGTKVDSDFTFSRSQGPSAPSTDSEEATPQSGESFDASAPDIEETSEQQPTQAATDKGKKRKSSKKIEEEPALETKVKLHKEKPLTSGLSLEQKESFLAKTAAREKIKREVEESDETMPLALGGWEALEHKEKQQEKTQKIESGESVYPALAPTALPEAPMQTSTPFIGSVGVEISPIISEVFERMVGSMVVMQEAGIQETTIHLDAPQFASSMFFGAEIVIREFSTAPKIFNIELRGAPQAVNAMQRSSEDLMAAFGRGSYTFQVNRIDAVLIQTERKMAPAKKKPRVRKVEKIEEEPT